MEHHFAVSRDYIGKRGEAIAITRFMNPCGNRQPYFDPHPLGEKCPTYDFLVELVGLGPAAPFFFAQVKTTSQRSRRKNARLKVTLRPDDVSKMIRSLPYRPT